MIDARELRIGNIVYFNNYEQLDIDQIKNLTFIDFEQICYDKHANRFSPIQINTEILEKWCKFDIVKETYNNGKENIIRADFFIDVYTFLSVYPNNDIILTQIKEKKVYALNEMERIKLKPVLYLHQLQNLIYALTGEELKVNYDFN